jgi:sugar/nucleoside kinase (ribokinase family)
LLKYAKEKGARIISDAGGARGIETEKIKEILHIIHGLFGNKPEIECLETRLNMPISEVSKRLWVVKKDGGHNTELYSDGKLALSIPPQLFINPVNSLGAGDAFAAAFLNAYLVSSDFANAISKGNAYAGKILNKQEFH